LLNVIHKLSGLLLNRFCVSSFLWKMSWLFLSCQKYKIHLSPISFPTWTDNEALAAGWIKESYSPSFRETLANVYTAEVRLSGEGFLEAGIDNYKNSSVPIPNAILLLGGGFAGLVGLRKKFWPKS